jgi:hypothetical protein
VVLRWVLTCDNVFQKSAMSKHITAQNETYGLQSLVNLVNQKGHEKPIKDMYERYVAEVSKALSDQT